MAKKTLSEPAAYRHQGDTRPNIPPAKIAAEGPVPAVALGEYAYDPHLTPRLLFDRSGESDGIHDLLTRAADLSLSTSEEAELRGAFQRHDPWLEWSGKREEHEATSFQVDPVALHIHERISAQALVRTALRRDVQRDLFADPVQPYQEAVQFYQHHVDWANRLILGDSLQVMSSLARREGLAGKVQMIYMDPPYGIKFRSNFQPLIARRDVGTSEKDLVREPETVRAFRDSWHLGVHSYLSYLRYRLIVARELLSDQGSLFVQIGQTNVHLVRVLLDEVFGAANFVNQIAFLKTTSSTSKRLSSVFDYILWYGKTPDIKYNPLFAIKKPGAKGASGYRTVLLPTGELIPIGKFTSAGGDLDLPDGADLVAPDNYTSQSPGSRYDVELHGRTYRPEPGYWKTDPTGMKRIIRAERLLPGRTYPGYARRISDFRAYPLDNVWTDTLGQNQFGGPKVYATQTALRVVQRCLLMTTEAGDLVLDPTCGSGTTAVVAEEWGRRWIAIDTSRVAVSIARQRMLAASFQYYELKNEARGPAGGLVLKTVSHIMPSSITQNSNLDPIFEKHEAVLERCVSDCNEALQEVPGSVRDSLAAKLVAKERTEGKRAITDADRRRWLLPPANRIHLGNSRAPTFVDADAPVWYEWEIPFDTDPDWPEPLQKAVAAYREAWHAKMGEVDGCIEANAEQDLLVDQPSVARGIVRVSGPFTVEGVRPEELSIGEEGLFGGAPDDSAEDSTLATRSDLDSTYGDFDNLASYLHKMVSLLRLDGVTFPDNRHRRFARLEALFESSDSAGGLIHAEGEWEADAGGHGHKIGISFGPQCGPVTALQVEELVRAAARYYDELVIAGFSFDAAATAVIQEAVHPRLQIHQAYIRPDVNRGMDGLLKETPNSQLFTVFGQPEIDLRVNDDGEWVCKLLGVDVYDPLASVVRSTGASKVAAWFLDQDYDGRCFCITQSFFPNQKAWAKIARALGDAVDADTFEVFDGTESLPFAPGVHGRIAVKVIDPRGNEVMTVHPLQEE